MPASPPATEWAPRVQARRALDEPWKIAVPTALLLGFVSEHLELPEHSWDGPTFAIKGRQLIVAIARLARITQRKAFPYVARKADEIFRRQIEKVISKVTKGKSVLEFGDPSGEGTAWLWAQAIDDVLRDEGIEFVLEVQPPIQSVMAQAYNRVGILLGAEVIAENSARIAVEARDIARRITGINETTRKVFQRVIRQALDQGMTVTETAAQIRELMPRFNRWRVNTIARTELNNAWTRGSVMQFQESASVTHVSVIGCESREPGSPTYRGESTCNIQDVPVTDAHLLEFHPNHTGTMVPSRFGGR